MTKISHVPKHESSYPRGLPMRFTDNPYNLLGVGLALGGGIFALVSYFVLHSTPLTALGMSMIILGAVCLALGRTRPRIPPEASAILLQTGLENTAAIVEELGLRSNAIYLPSSLTSGGPQALMPLRSNPVPVQIREALPKRLIVKYGPDPEDIGILVTTPGSASLSMLGSKPGPSAGELEAAITAIVVGMLDVADGARVNMVEGRVIIEAMSPRLEYRNIWFYRCLGSPLASIVASLACEALDKPLIIEREAHEKGKCVIGLRVLD
ncbi:MAG: hypothetical protein ACE5JL_06165 [Dehalococcoidia bacterium]